MRSSILDCLHPYLAGLHYQSGQSAGPSALPSARQRPPKTNMHTRQQHQQSVVGLSWIYKSLSWRGFSIAVHMVNFALP